MNYSTLYNASANVNVAVLIAVATHRQPIGRTNECLDELEFLAQSNGIRTIKRFVQHLPQAEKSVLM